MISDFIHVVKTEKPPNKKKQKNKKTKKQKNRQSKQFIHNGRARECECFPCFVHVVREVEIYM